MPRIQEGSTKEPTVSLRPAGLVGREAYRKNLITHEGLSVADGTEFIGVIVYVGMINLGLRDSVGAVIEMNNGDLTMLPIEQISTRPQGRFAASTQGIKPADYAEVDHDTV